MVNIQLFPKFGGQVITVIMEKNLVLDDLWKIDLAAVYEHIKHDCTPGDYDRRIAHFI